MEASNIKRLTHSGHNKPEIGEWVEDHCPDPGASTAYAQKIPLNMLPLITEMKAVYFRAARVTVLGVSDGNDVGLHATFCHNVGNNAHNFLNFLQWTILFSFQKYSIHLIQN
jgi:flavodoxin